MITGQVCNFYLKLLSKASDALSRDGLFQPVHLDPQASSQDVCLSTSDEFIKCIVDEDVLGLHVWAHNITKS